MGYKQFCDLQIWQDALSLLKEVYLISNSLPKEESFCLTRDLRRTANSILANIAESHGRYFFADKVRVLYIARGEINEIRSHLLVVKELQYYSKEILNNLYDKYLLLEKHLNMHLNSLVKQKSLIF